MTNTLARNRAEELGLDVWDSFVIPPLFATLGLGISTKPRVFIGGRGCGKTMLLRYLSHDTTFSRKRPSIPSDWWRHIGLYWKADTQFAALMTGRETPSDVWQAAFEHLLALKLAGEIVQALVNIGSCPHTGLTRSDLAAITLAPLKAYLEVVPASLEQLADILRDRTAQLVMWVSNVRTKPVPTFLPGNIFVRALIEVIQAQCTPLRDSVFFVFVDEYENLQAYQQRTLNTNIKSSQPPLIFNFAMKRHGIRTHNTLGEEVIQPVADYREVDLEEYEGDGFERFAAEVFIHNYEGERKPPITIESLRDPTFVDSRTGKEYEKLVTDFAKTVFQGATLEAIAEEILTRAGLMQTLVRWLSRGLRRHRWGPQRSAEFIDPQHPLASVVAPCLLNRSRPGPALVLREFQKLQKGKDNKFTGRTEWIHNNLFSSILYIYEPYSIPCPLYSGFSTYCQLAHGNLRHLLDLCHVALSRGIAKRLDISSVSPDVQAEAARSVSTAAVRNVRSFGTHGNALHRLVLCLGSLFALAHRRPGQNEPEQNHFVLVDEHNLGKHQYLSELLLEALKWSVLIESRETKRKSEPVVMRSEYVLNPIFAPYFHISYRKKRKLEIRIEDIGAFVESDYSVAAERLTTFAKRWTVNVDEEVPPLFAHLRTTLDGKDA